VKANDSIRIKGDYLIKLIQKRTACHMSLNKITKKYHEENPDSHKYKRSTIHDFMKRKLGITYGKVATKDPKVYERVYTVSKSVFKETQLCD
jgi:hypothetical protein